MVQRPTLQLPRYNTVPSRDTGIGNAPKKQQLRYTGTKLLGIGLRHKSGYEPVFSEEQARDLAQMRR